MKYSVGELNWREVYNFLNPVSRLNVVMKEVLHRFVPTRLIRIRSNDRPWFNDQCRVLDEEKQAAYRRWKQAALSRIDQPRKWWFNLKSAVMGTEPAILHLIDPDSGTLVSDPVAKADLLMNHFDGKQSQRVLDLPASCTPAPSFCSFAFRSSEVLKLLSGLDDYGGSDSLGFSPCFIVKLRIFWHPSYVRYSGYC